MKIDGVTMRASEAPGKDEIIRHIDKMGVERVLKRGNTHVFEKHKETTSQSIVKALNSIMAVAPKKRRGEQDKRYKSKLLFYGF